MARALQNATEKTRKGEALKESEENYHRLFEDASLPVAGVNLTGRQVYGNEAHHDMFSYFFPEIMERSPIALIKLSFTLSIDDNVTVRK